MEITINGKNDLRTPFLVEASFSSFPNPRIKSSSKQIEINIASSINQIVIQ